MWPLVVHSFLIFSRKKCVSQGSLFLFFFPPPPPPPPPCLECAVRHVENLPGLRVLLVDRSLEACLCEANAPLYSVDALADHMFHEKPSGE